MATTKQERTVHEVIRNNKSVQQAMLDSGYSESSARALEVKKTKGWNELLNQYLTDKNVLKTHKEALKATRPVVVKDEIIDVADYSTRLKAVELSYKAKGRLKQEDIGNVAFAGVKIEFIDTSSKETDNPSTR